MGNKLSIAFDMNGVRSDVLATRTASTDLTIELSNPLTRTPACDPMPITCTS